MPFTVRVPVGEAMAVRCLTATGSPWSVVHPAVTVPVTGDHPIHFELVPDTGAAAPHLAVKTLTQAGQPAYVLGDEAYRRLGDQLGTPLPHGPPVDVAPGVRLQVHEDGPVLEVETGATQEGGRVAALIAEVLTEVVPPDVMISTEVSALVPAALARVDVRMPAGGARALVGPLATTAELLVEVPGEDSAWEQAAAIPLSRLEEDPVIAVPPGQARLRLTLPWGSWREEVRARLAEPVVIDLPGAVGAPPLRVRLQGSRWPEGYAVLGVDAATAPQGTVRAGLFGAGPEPLRIRPDPETGWVLDAPEGLDARSHRGGWIAALGTGPATAFPLSPVRALAVEGLGVGARVEPLSAVAAGEWDLLVATGRIGAIPPDGLVELVSTAGVDEVLGLAAAYALRARSQWDHLAAVLGELSRRDWLGLDVALLDGALTLQTRDALPAGFVEELTGRAGRGEVPILRWGVALAVRIVPSGPGLDRWRDELARIDASLSAHSVWTVWAE